MCFTCTFSSQCHKTILGYSKNCWHHVYSNKYKKLKHLTRFHCFQEKIRIMEVELGLKITTTRDDTTSVSDFQFAKDRSGPVFLSKETDAKLILTAHLKGFFTQILVILCQSLLRKIRRKNGVFIEALSYNFSKS